MLLDQYSRRERVHRVTREHGDGCLKDDRPAVELRSHEVHGRASETNTVFERLTLGVETWKGGKKRRMDVEDPIGKRFEQRFPDDPHEPCKADQFNAAVEKNVGDRTIAGLFVGKVSCVDDASFNSGVTCAHKPGRVGPIRDHHSNVCIEPAPSNGVDDGLKIRSPAGDENADSTIHWRER